MSKFKIRLDLQIWRFIITFIISISLLIYSINNGQGNNIRNFFGNIIDFFVVVNNNTGNVVDTISTNFTDVQVLTEENELYRKRILELETEINYAKGIERENRELRSLLKIPVYSYQKKYVARVNAINIDNKSNNIVINVGKNKEVYVNQPVLNSQGLIGRVVNVFDLSSRVQLLTDINNYVSVENLSNNERYTVNGNATNILTVNFVPVDSNIKVGDILVTDGVEGLFAPGLFIAKVSSVKRNQSNFLAVEAEIGFNVNSIHYVALVWKDRISMSDSYPTSTIENKK